MSPERGPARRKLGLLATVAGMGAAIVVLMVCTTRLEPLLGRRLDKPLAHHLAFAASFLLSVLAYTAVVRAVGRTGRPD